MLTARFPEHLNWHFTDEKKRAELSLLLHGGSVRALFLALLRRSCWYFRFYLQYTFFKTKSHKTLAQLEQAHSHPGAVAMCSGIVPCSHYVTDQSQLSKCHSKRFRWWLKPCSSARPEPWVGCLIPASHSFHIKTVACSDLDHQGELQKLQLQTGGAFG